MMCNQGFVDCDKSAANGCEVNTGTDPINCGACGTKCQFPNAAVSVCNAGMCKMSMCSPGYQDCDNDPTDTDGCETNINVDALNCGKCNGACSLQHAIPGCAGGNCTVMSCNANYQDCNHVASDGCEVSTQADPLNCGGCNHQCFAPNGIPGCAGGNCTVAACNPNFANCNGIVADGCEVNTQTDALNCGGCGNKCSTSGKTTCTGGVCH
jgi:hypothetical protein